MPYLRSHLLKGDEGAEDVPISKGMTKSEEIEMGHKGMVKHVKDELRVEDVVMDVDQVSPRPPTPPESRPSTSRVTIAPCPVRLLPLVPPENYGAVESYTIYRSAYPNRYNVEFLQSLNLRSILTLVESEASEEYAQYIQMYGVNHARIPIVANKKGEVRTTTDSLCQAILFVMNPTNHPLYIHCNRGKHRTGCVVACLRKIQRWPVEEVLREYETYAAPKCRPEDIELIKAFDPKMVFEYAKTHNLLERHDSAVSSVYELADNLPSYDLALCADGFSDTSDSDSDSIMLPIARMESTIIDEGNKTLVECFEDEARARPSGRRDVEMTDVTAQEMECPLSPSDLNNIGGFPMLSDAQL